MAEFCVDCPRKDNCEGEIVGVHVLNIVTEGTVSNDGRTAMMSFEQGVPKGPTEAVVQFTDAQGQTSETFSVSGHTFAGADDEVGKQITRIDKCTGPTTTKRLFGLLTKKACGSIKL